VPEEVCSAVTPPGCACPDANGRFGRISDEEPMQTARASCDAGVPTTTTWWTWLDDV
jgi:hypothetical protein